MTPALVSALLVTLAAADSPASLPAAWMEAWKQPPAADRPLQIVHGIDSRGRIVEGVEQMVSGKKLKATAKAGMQYYKDRGLGGVVCNVAFRDYLRSEENWQTLARGIEACRQLGMVVWLYDEEGYPSGAAGGLVLRENPAFEAQALVFDASRGDPFVVRPAYEHTHASNNYHAARRYINLIDDRAVRAFIAKTHEAYWHRLQPYFGSTIQATFTDEPSLIAVNLGQLPESVRKTVRVVDPVDASVKPLPSVPWCYDLPEQYRRRYGEDLLAGRRSLFGGDSTADRKVRRQFWALIADLVAERYFGTIEDWCGRHKIASSGHSLWEEEVMHHPALEGSGLKVLSRMDIPGLDMLSSNPEGVIHSGWMTAALPSSAAELTGRRRVMTEVSDFAEKMGGRGPASLAEMQATAAWQAAWGVTEFTLYYGVADRPADQYRAYCSFVGRLNAILKPARLDPQVLLYYPIYDLWAEYVPVAEPLRLGSQSPRAQRIVRSFEHLGQTLQRNQIPFALIDHERLASAGVEKDGSLAIHGHRFRSLLLPADVELPPPAARVVDELRKKGGRVLTDRAAAQLSGPTIVETVKPPYQISPRSPYIAAGHFLRDGRRVVLLANVGREAYQGHLEVGAAEDWLILDPSTGTVTPTKASSGAIRVSLESRHAIVLVQSGPLARGP